MSIRKLKKRVAETILLVGGDEHSGLHLKRSRNEETSSEGRCKKYQPNILGIIDESTAIYPFHLLKKDPFYPPQQFKQPTQSRQGILSSQTSTTDDKDEVGFLNVTMRKRNTGHWKCRASLSTSGLKTIERRKTVIKKSTSDGIGDLGETSIKNETIEGIPSLCYPSGLTMCPFPLPVKIHYFVLTNIKGERLYAVSMTVYRKYQCSEDEDGFVTLKGIDGDEPDEYLRSSNYNYVPTTIIVISKFPYYSTLSEVFSVLHEAYSCKGDHFNDLVAYFAACLLNTPVPPAGNIYLNISFFGQHIALSPPILPSNKILDFDITLIFRLLSISDVIYIVIALILQRRLVLVSKQPMVTTLCCEILIHLIQPFEWRFTYVPFLPQSLLEILDAPGPYILGCDVEDMASINEIKDVIVVNLEKGSVKTSDDQTVPLPPAKHISQLICSLEPMNAFYDRFMLEKLPHLSFETASNQRKLFNLANQILISEAFNDFFLDIFEDVQSFIHQNGDASGLSIYFQSENFLRFHTECKEFYSEVLKTDMFELFLITVFNLNSNLSNRNSANLPQRQNERVNSIPTISRQRSRPRQSSSAASTTPIRSVLSFDEKVDQAQQQLMVIELPAFGDKDGENENSNFFDRCIEYLNDNCKEDYLSPEYNAALNLVKCDMNLINKRNIDVLRNVHTLLQIDSKYVSKQDVISVINDLSTLELEECSNLAFFNNLKEIVSYIRQTSTSNKPEHIERNFEIPPELLNRDQFGELLQRASITWNTELQDKLFTCFTFDQIHSDGFRLVDPAMFKLFYLYWVQLADDIDIEQYAHILAHTEIVLKVSSQMIRIDPEGSGYLIVTQERLLFVPMGGRPVRTLIHFSEITDILEEVGGFNIFSYGMKTVSIHHNVPNRKKIVLWFKMTTDIWLVLLKELWSGHKIAAEFKDVSIINLAIDHFLVLDTLYSCAENEDFFDKHINKFVRLLTVFTRMQKNNERLSEPTKKALVQRVVPMSQDPSKRSIEALMWVKKKFPESLYDTMWAIFNTNPLAKVVTIDMDYFTVRKTVLSVNTRFMCLLWVEPKFLWVGAKDHKIYVIDSNTGNLVQELIGNRDIVLTLTKSEEQRLVASVNSTGEIILWHSQTRKIERKWRVDNCTDVMFSGQNLLCNTRSEIIVYNTPINERISRLQLTQTSSSPRMHARYGIECIAIIGHYVYLGLGRQAQLLIFDIQRIVAPVFVTSVDLDSATPPCSPPVTCNKCIMNKQKDRRKCVDCKPANRCRGLSQLVALSEDQIWACCKDGNIYVFQLSTGQTLHLLHGHSDAIQSVCTNQAAVQEDLLVFTGGRSEDSKVVVWKANAFQ